MASAVISFGHVGGHGDRDNHERKALEPREPGKSYGGL